jgi:hypothetical protein
MGQKKKREQEPTQYPAKSWVFWELPEPRKGDPTSTRRLGPYQVISQVGNAVTIFCNEKEKVIPVSACTAFIPGQVAPERLQAENSKAVTTRYYVESIVDHAFEDPKSPKLGNCKLLIKWSGYPEQWHFLLEVPDIRETEALLNYVKARPSLTWLLAKALRPK